MDGACDKKYMHNLRGRDHFGQDQIAEDNIKTDLKTENEGWNAFNLTRETGSCEHGNAPSGSIKGGEFLDYLSDCQLLKKDSAPWN
jgi:hypothetical protein